MWVEFHNEAKLQGKLQDGIYKFFFCVWNEGEQKVRVDIVTILL